MVTNNSTFVDDDVSQAMGDVMHNTALRVFFISAYSIIFVLGITGNTLVVYVVWSNPSMRTITNVFIANLAVADILICLVAVPFTPISGMLDGWPFGDLLCHLIPMILCVSIYLSTLTSTAIAVDRYFVIVYPFRPRMHVVSCVVLIIAIWLVSISVSLPLALYQQVQLEPGGEFSVCTEHWPGPASRQFFTIISLTLQYIVPCIIITYCYMRVSAVLRRRACAKIGTGSVSSRPQTSSSHCGHVNGHRSTAAIDDDDYRAPGTAAASIGSASTSIELRNRMKLQRKRRTNRMLIAMVVIFVVCWMPLNIVLFTSEYSEEFVAKPYFLLIFFVAHVIGVSSTMYNPFLYAWMNDNFRKEFRRVLPCLRWTPRRAASSTTICGRRFTFRFSLYSGGHGRTGGSPSYYSTVGYPLMEQGVARRPTVLRLSHRHRNAGNNKEDGVQTDSPQSLVAPPPTAAAAATTTTTGCRKVMYDVRHGDIHTAGNTDFTGQRTLAADADIDTQ